MECAALVRAIRHGDLDRLMIPDAPLDILAQQIVAICAAAERVARTFLPASDGGENPATGADVDFRRHAAGRPRYTIPAGTKTNYSPW